MKRFKKFIACVLSLSLAFLTCACGDAPIPDQTGKPDGPTTGTNEPELPALGTSVGYDERLRIDDNREITAQQYTMYNTTGVDDYGRTILTVDGKASSIRYVGLFYFLLLGQHSMNATAIYDISKITNNGENNAAFQCDSEESPYGLDHHWGESAFGYYDSGDEWVIRKQVEMFVAAGIDFLVFDCTNGWLYQDNVRKLFNVLLEYQKAGWNVPKIMYYLARPKKPADVGPTYVQNLLNVYDFAYKTKKYQSLWFCPEGKPLITMHQDHYSLGKEKYYGLDMSDPAQNAIFNLFQFKCRQWPNENGYEPDGVPWIDWGYPQHNHNGWMNVSVAQHPTSRFSDPKGTRGRGYDITTKQNDHDRWKEDINLQSQWQTVIDDKDDVQYVFVTGWNEWIANKMRDNKGVYFMVDTYNAEYSRDIEPSEANGDNAYILNAQKIREYNYLEARHYVYPKTTIDITKDDEAWANIKEYVDFTNDCKDRDYKTFLPKTANVPNYTDNSGRNDISTVKVARDDYYLYFRVTVAGNSITTPQSGDKKWMNIWIKTTNGTETYNGYNYVINRAVNGNKTTVQKANNGQLTDCATGDLYLDGNVMVVRVALSDLDLSPTNYDIEFKVTDNVNEADTFNYLDYYRTGDSAPIGRLNYRYGY